MYHNRAYGCFIYIFKFYFLSHSYLFLQIRSFKQTATLFCFLGFGLNLIYQIYRTGNVYTQVVKIHKLFYCLYTPMLLILTSFMSCTFSELNPVYFYLRENLKKFVYIADTPDKGIQHELIVLSAPADKNPKD